MSDLEHAARPSLALELRGRAAISCAWAMEKAREHSSFLFASACLIGLWTDPLFFYVPFIHDESMCIGTDRGIKKVALIFRSVTDISYLVDMIYHIRKTLKLSTDKPQSPKISTAEEGKKFQHVIAFAKKLSWWPVLLDFFAILPIPQVFILYVFYHPYIFGVPKNKMILNIFVLIQYVPRIYVAFLTTEKYRKISPTLLTGAFYFFMFILMGYVFGGMWYFSAIQKQLKCMFTMACKDNEECTGFYCNEEKYSGKTYWDIGVGCSEKEWEGLYSDIMKSAYFGNTYDKKTLLSLQGKILYFTWWGLKNLCNFGTNLSTSYQNMWDNVFSILVCGVGLVLFAYLIGHMQTLMQTSEDAIRAKERIKERKEKLGHWMNDRGILITPKIKNEIKEDKNADLGYIYCLPDSVRKDICMVMLEKIPELGTMNPAALQIICDCLKPVIYAEKSFVSQTGELLDSVLFIVEGTIIIYSKNGDDADSPSTIRYVIEDRGVYGHKELLTGVSTTTSGTQVSLESCPISTVNVKCHTRVEGFVLNAEDLKTALDKINRLPADHVEMKELVVESPFHTGGTPLIDRGPGSFRRRS